MKPKQARTILSLKDMGGGKVYSSAYPTWTSRMNVSTLCTLCTFIF